jgi:hypothetical protein
VSCLPAPAHRRARTPSTLPRPRPCSSPSLRS